MPQIINTGNLKPREDLSDLDRLQIYCGLDSCVTTEVFEAIAPQLDPVTQVIYDFERALQAPVLEMMLRGILVDTYEVNKLRSTYINRRERIQWILNEFARAVWGKELKAGSYPQVSEFFYTYLKLSKQYKYEKGQRKLTVNREALENLSNYRYGRPIAKAVLSWRDHTKKIAVLKSGIDEDSRMRFGINIGGTHTGRFSFNENAFGGGTNSANITDELRRIFISGKGRKMAYLDLEQAESRVVAYRSGDERYIAACESSDLHTEVAKLIWKELHWSEQARPNSPPAEYDRAIAERKFYRHFSYRDLSKRGGHLTNYLGQPDSNARKLKVSRDVMRNFNRTYLDEFSGIRRWHTDTARVLQTEAKITTCLGRKRLFFSRGWEDDSLRKAVAYDPQSSIGDLLNLGMWRIWKYLPKADLLTQLYDAVLIEYDEEDEEEIIPAAVELMTIPLQIKDTRYREAKTRTMIIPVDASVGWNWAKYVPENDPEGRPANLDGQKKYKGKDERVRQVQPDTNLLLRKM